MTYCANVDAGRISRSNSLNMANIRLIRAKNPTATILGQPPRTV
jgi:hypothetical protein